MSRVARAVQKPSLSMRTELAQDLTPGDYLVEYGTAVADINLITDPFPEGTHADIKLANGDTLWLPGGEDVLVRDGDRPSDE